MEPARKDGMIAQFKAGPLNRALSNLRIAWQNIAGAAYDETAASLRPDLPEDDVVRLREQMAACLGVRGGEVSARARAAALGRAYLALDATGRKRFLRVLAKDFGIDRDAVDQAMEVVRGADEGDPRRHAENALRRALEPPRLRLLTQFNALPEGVKFLVDMRAELLPLSRRDPALRALEDDLKALLTTWFDVDFLELRRITWDSSPAALLEKLIAYEAVHPIESWDDLKNRLDSDRRWYAYFHPSMPSEPLIFVEVALVRGMAGNVNLLLDETAPVLDPKEADTAIFYSISNAQKGLAGISFGNFLIKRVVDALTGEFPQITTFATLSPVPGFRAWLDKRLEEGHDEQLAAFADLLADPAWPHDADRAGQVRGPLMGLCARYLAQEKRSDGRRARDPVAHFHLTNGARMERLNWLGDTSSKGLEQAHGMMINYQYKLGDIDDNSDHYVTDGRVAMSSAFKAHLRG
ncbi:MAG: malonyl-CoA decarboxylase [Rhodobacterales bacterium]|nr:malonyl-CoA decarboxylase [Rhodobacterales bacterium]